MAGTIDYQKIHNRYQIEGVPRQISIVKFCEQNGVFSRESARKTLSNYYL